MRKKRLIIYVFIFLTLSLTVYLCFSVFRVAYIKQIKEASKEFDVDPYLILAVVKTESSFDKNALSKKGAVGLMQLLPSTAKELSEELGIEYSYEKLFEPDYNIRLGTFYLKKLFDIFGSEKLVLLAYNSGPGALQKYLDSGKDINKYPYKESLAYVKKTEYYKNLYLKRKRLFQAL